MKTNLLLSLTLLAASSLLAADSDPKTDVMGAAKALGNQPNYSWHTTSENANGGFRRGPTDGKTEKDGYTTLSMTFGDNTTEVVIKGSNAAIKTADNGWQSAAEASKDNGGGGFNPTAFIAGMAQNFKTPSAEAASLVSQTKELTAGTNEISGDLTEAGAKSLLAFRRGGNGDGPTVTNPKGSIKFWVTDGKLVKYQTHVTGTVSFNGNDREVDRTTTTEIKDVGATKIEVSDDARKKLE